MNTVGKTLVVVNLLFALLTGGFLVVDFMTRENWKKRVDDLKRELEVAQAVNGEIGVTLGKSKALSRDLEKKVSELENKVKDDESKYKRDIAEAKQEAETERGTSQKQQLTSMVSLGENERLKVENKKLTETLARREKTINDLEVDKNNAVNQAITFQSQKQAADERSASLLERVVELERAVIRANVTGGVPVTATAKSSNKANPPPAYVKGIVEKVDRETGLVQLSIGTDAGVGVNNTLEAYRLRPRPEYLGMIRIVDANQHKAVGRLMRLPSVPQQPNLREGDEVASTLTPPS